MTGSEFKKLALSFEGTTARRHFDRTAFRTTRKIFATLGSTGRDVNVRLELDTQGELCEAHPDIVAPVPGGWGRMGWTTIALPDAPAKLVKQILTDAHALAVPQKAPRKAGAVDPRARKLLGQLRSDPAFGPVVADYEKQVAMPGRKFGKNGLKTNGKLFALFTQGTLVVKLPNERVGELVKGRVGRYFDPGHGRLMKGWLTVTSSKASWVTLAKEGFAFVDGGSE